MTLFDRSWYNRAGVEHVMGFCTKQQYAEFLHQAPIFERLLVEDGILLRKYWFSVSDSEQQKRFESRLDDPMRRWKLSPMDLESISRWESYSRAKDDMFTMTDIPEAPWFVVESDDKRRARINMIAHLLSTVPYTDVKEPSLKLPSGRSRPATSGRRWTPRPSSPIMLRRWSDRQPEEFAVGRSSGTLGRVSDEGLRRRAAELGVSVNYPTGRDAMSRCPTRRCGRSSPRSSRCRRRPGSRSATAVEGAADAVAPVPSERSWGFTIQLYSLRSRRSWGHGDLRDLADFAAWSAGELGAGFALINPLHAAEPVPPVSPRPTCR